MIPGSQHDPKSRDVAWRQGSDLRPRTVSQHGRQPALTGQLESARRGRRSQQGHAPGNCRAQREKQNRERDARDVPNSWPREKQARRRRRVSAEDSACQHGRWLQDQAQARRAAQAGMMTSDPLVPPNPNEFDNAVRIVILRAALGT
jgi:hypothetical protein